MPNIVVIDDGGDVGALVAALAGHGYQCLPLQNLEQFLAVAGHAAADALLLRTARLEAATLDQLHALSLRDPLPVVVLAGHCELADYPRAMAAGVSVLQVGAPSPPPTPALIHAAAARFQHDQHLKAALEEARAQLQDRKQIDRAKAILMKARQLGEDEAYHTLRKLAMARNITVGEMARNVIAMAELLK